MNSDKRSRVESASPLSYIFERHFLAYIVAVLLSVIYSGSDFLIQGKILQQTFPHSIPLTDSDCQTKSSFFTTIFYYDVHFEMVVGQTYFVRQESEGLQQQQISYNKQDDPTLS
mmetsp:Transcript_31529/g.76399  ORF Transcript_31529/g.76399 Transcript_31529/m.76399 type:complete len:114 (-) Transcript_31529:1996-2337(-)